MTDRRYGGFWRRYFAYLIDKVILYLISLFLFLTGILALGLGGGSLGRVLATGNIPRGMGLYLIIYTVASSITDMVYFTWFHGSVGQTPGKMLLGLRVIQASGEKMTFGIAFLRWAGSLVSGLFLWLGYLWIAFDRRKRGWHDMIAATLVIRAGNEPDGGSAPDATAHPSPNTLPVAPDSAGAVPSVAPAPPATSASNAPAPDPAGRDAADPAPSTALPGRAPAIPSAPANRDTAGPASGAPGDLPDRD